jgi:hypothetical protein
MNNCVHCMLYNILNNYNGISIVWRKINLNSIFFRYKSKHNDTTKNSLLDVGATRAQLLGILKLPKIKLNGVSL